MRARIAYGACVLAVVVSCLAIAPSALAAPGGLDGFSAESGIGALSDRYASLNSLGNSLTEEESVVIETRIGVLTSVNRALDDGEVRFTGEVVGDLVNAPQLGYKWANAAGASNSVISVFLSDEQASLVKSTGSYHAVGTSLKITGTYHVACPVHQGELDVHAINVELVSEGGPLDHPVDKKRFTISAVLCAAAVLVLAAFLFVSRHVNKREEHDPV